MAGIDFTFRELETFCKVVELESFSKAAKAVFLVQASVSERIASLENKVGTRLLDRLGRMVKPTAAGELLYKHATLLLEMKSTAQSEIERFFGLEQGEIALGGSTIPGEYILPGLISRFINVHPQLMVVLNIADSREIEYQVLKGKLDIGVIGFQSLQSNLSCQPLWQDELVVVIPARHAWSGRSAISIADLCKMPFILREEGSGTLKMLESFLRASGLKGSEALKVCARLGSSTSIKEGVKAGLGISILSKIAIEADVRAGLLKALTVKGLPMSRNFYLIRNRWRIASPASRTMHTFLLSETPS